MTYRCNTMNPHDALYDLARRYPSGIEGLAQHMGINGKILYKKLSPATPTHSATAEQFSEVMERCVGANVPDALQPLMALNWRHGLVAFALPDHEGVSDTEITMQACIAMKEIGDVMGSVTTALHDNMITASERDRFEKEISEAMTALAVLRERFNEKFSAAGTGRVTQ